MAAAGPPVAAGGDAMLQQLTERQAAADAWYKEKSAKFEAAAAEWKDNEDDKREAKLKLLMDEAKAVMIKAGQLLDEANQAVRDERKHPRSDDGDAEERAARRQRTLPETPFGEPNFEAALANGDEFMIEDEVLKWNADPAMANAASALVEAQPEELDAGVEWTDGAMLPFDDDQVSYRGLATREGTRAITEEVLKDICEARRRTITVITGSPGIGKTRTITHIAKRVLEGGGKRAEGQPNDEVWANVLIFNLKSNNAFLIVRRGERYHAWRSTCPDKANSSLFLRHDMHVLVDPEEAKKGGAKFAHPLGAHLILAASANEKHFEGVSKVELGRSKRPRFMFYAPTWTHAELLAVRAKLASGVSAETMQQRFHEVGGAPRYVFSGEQLRDRVGKIGDAVHELSKDMVSKALENGSINGVGQNTVPGCFFTFVAAEPHYDKPVVRFLSKYARLVVANHYRAEVLGLARFGNRTELAGEEGFLLEELVRSDMVLGGTFTARKLGKDAERVKFKACGQDGVVFGEHLGLAQSKEALVSLFAEDDEEEESRRRVLLPCKNFPAIDFADSERRVFQVTTNARHDFKADLVAVVLEAAGILTRTVTKEELKGGREVEKTTYQKNNGARPIAWYWTTPERHASEWRKPRAISRGNASAKLHAVVKECAKTHLVQHLLLVPEKCPRGGGGVAASSP